MLPSAIDFYVFSGTGNTLLAARAMGDVFSAAGREVRLLPLESSDPARIDLGRGLGLAFPVAACSTYPLVWRFLDALPQAKGTGAFMLDTLGGFSGGIVGPLRHMLEARGYDALGACEIVMPGNFLRLEPPERCRPKIERGCAEARQFAADLLAGSAGWDRVPVFSDLVSAASRFLTSLWKYRFSRSLLEMRVDAARCTGCGLCARLCPVGAIEMRENLARPGAACEYCQRCAAVCPADAIRCGASPAAYRAIAAADYLRPDGGGSR